MREFLTPSKEIKKIFNPPQVGLQILLTTLTSRPPPYCWIENDQPLRRHRNESYVPLNGFWPLRSSPFPLALKGYSNFAPNDDFLPTQNCFLMLLIEEVQLTLQGYIMFIRIHLYVGHT